jgi:hypothetical protein
LQFSMHQERLTPGLEPRSDEFAGQIDSEVACRIRGEYLAFSYLTRPRGFPALAEKHQSLVKSGHQRLANRRLPDVMSSQIAGK